MPRWKSWELHCGALEVFELEDSQVGLSKNMTTHKQHKHKLSGPVGSASQLLTRGPLSACEQVLMGTEGVFGRAQRMKLAYGRTCSKATLFVSWSLGRLQHYAVHQQCTHFPVVLIVAELD